MPRRIIHISVPCPLFDQLLSFKEVYVFYGFHNRVSIPRYSIAQKTMEDLLCQVYTGGRVTVFMEGASGVVPGAVPEHPAIPAEMFEHWPDWWFHCQTMTALL